MVGKISFRKTHQVCGLKPHIIIFQHTWRIWQSASQHFATTLQLPPKCIGWIFEFDECQLQILYIAPSNTSQWWQHLHSSFFPRKRRGSVIVMIIKLLPCASLYSIVKSVCLPSLCPCGYTMVSPLLHAAPHHHIEYHFNQPSISTITNKIAFRYHCHLSGGKVLLIWVKQVKPGFTNY